MLILYKGVPEGTFSEMMISVDKKDGPIFQKRLIFDLSFFIWVGMILFNIITGLLVDGFGSLREEDNERRDILENSCFVCGFTRTGYDDIPNFRGPNFDYHLTDEHNYWSYVHYYVYLKRKNKTEFNGVDTFVWAMLQEGNLGWIPVRNSAAIQQANIVIEDPDAVAENPALNEHFDKVSSLIKSSMDALASKQQKNKDALMSNATSFENAPLTMAAFLAKGGLESYANVLISRGFPDPVSLDDLSGLDDVTLGEEIGMNELEIRRLKALVELRDFESAAVAGGTRRRGRSFESSNAPTVSTSSTASRSKTKSPPAKVVKTKPPGTALSL
mmetsp:Transcript_10620/g.13902  ORF Transcript_10620/g.13902 Transcript_10620/m.13902 type:complete len:330 (+) Transcript_10620:253-1242(+)